MTVVTLFLDKIGDDTQFDQDFPKQTREEVVLRTILKQLIQAHREKDVPSPALNSWSTSRTDTLDVSLEAMRTLIHAEADAFEEVFVLVDALDQCPEEAQEKLKAEFSRFLEGTSKQIRLLMMQSAPGLPSPDRVSCDISECSSASVILYWHCSECHGGKFRVCQLCYEKEFRCLEKYVIHCIKKNCIHELTSYLQGP